MGNNDKQDNIDREDELAISLMEIEDEYLSPFLSDEFNATKTESLKYVGTMIALLSLSIFKFQKDKRHDNRV